MRNFWNLQATLAVSTPPLRRISCVWTWIKAKAVVLFRDDGDGPCWSTMVVFRNVLIEMEGIHLIACGELRSPPKAIRFEMSSLADCLRY